MMHKILTIMIVTILCFFFVACKEEMKHDHSKHVSSQSCQDGCGKNVAKKTCEDGCNEHIQEKDACNDRHDHSRHDHDHNGEIDLEALAQEKCEHNILQIECLECQGELGLVKLDSDVENAFIQTQTVEKKKAMFHLELVGELAVNQLKTSVITPILAGRVNKIIKKLGDQVQAGELLCLLESQEYGKAKFDYITAHQNYLFARKNYEWFTSSHTNLKKLLEALQKGDKNLDLSPLITGIKIGKYKQELIATASAYRVMQAKYERETQVIKNMKRLYHIIQDTSKIPSIDTELKKLVIGEWKGKLLGAMSILEISQKNYDRERSLSKSNVGTPKELYESESNYRKALAEYQGLVEEFALFLDQKERELQADWEFALAGYFSKLEEIEMDLDLHQLEVEQTYLNAVSQKSSAEKMLEILGLAKKDIEKLNQTDVGKSLGILEIRAPIDGTILTCDLSEGQFVESNKGLYTISDLQNIWVWCDVYESNLSLLKPFENELSKLSATLILPKPYQENVKVELDYLSEQVKETTRTVKIRGIVSNQKKDLKPGLFVKLQIQIPTHETSILVPENAIFKDDKQTFLFKRMNNYWVRTNVALGRYNQNQREILSGIMPGDLIAVEGGFLLKSEVLKSKMGAG